MRYVTSIERLAKEEGYQEGSIQKAQDSLLNVLEVRFTEVPKSIIQVVNQINDEDALTTLLKRAITIPNLADFQQLLDDILSEESDD